MAPSADPARPWAALGPGVVDLEEEPEASCGSALAWRLTSCCRLATKLPTGLACLDELPTGLACLDAGKPARGEARPEPGVSVVNLGKRTGNAWFELFIS